MMRTGETWLAAWRLSRDTSIPNFNSGSGWTHHTRLQIKCIQPVTSTDRGLAGWRRGLGNYGDVVLLLIAVVLVGDYRWECDPL